MNKRKHERQSPRSALRGGAGFISCQYLLWERHTAGTLAELLSERPIPPHAVLLLHGCHFCVQTGNLTYDALADMPADFGPRVLAEGIRGLLMVRPGQLCRVFMGPELKGRAAPLSTGGRP